MISWIKSLFTKYDYDVSNNIAHLYETRFGKTTTFKHYGNPRYLNKTNIHWINLNNLHEQISLEKNIMLTDQLNGCLLRTWSCGGHPWLFPPCPKPRVRTA